MEPVCEIYNKYQKKRYCCRLCSLQKPISQNHTLTTLSLSLSFENKVMNITT